MNGIIREALTLKYKGEIAAANANVKVYLLNPAGIGAHSDIIQAIDEQIEKAANAKEKLDYILALKY